MKFNNLTVWSCGCGCGGCRCCNWILYATICHGMSEGMELSAVISSTLEALTAIRIVVTIPLSKSTLTIGRTAFRVLSATITL